SILVGAAERQRDDKTHLARALAPAVGLAAPVGQRPIDEQRIEIGLGGNPGPALAAADEVARLLEIVVRGGTGLAAAFGAHVGRIAADTAVFEPVQFGPTARQPLFRVVRDDTAGLFADRDIGEILGRHQLVAE